MADSETTAGKGDSGGNPLNDYAPHSREPAAEPWRCGALGGGWVNWTMQDLVEHERRRSDPSVPKWCTAHNQYGHSCSDCIAAGKTKSTAKAHGRIREPKGLNKTEKAYSAHLDLEKRLGAIRWWRFEGMTLKLADDCRLTPDFVVMLADGTLELHDTKVIHRGQKRPHIEDDALVKLRTAAEMYEITIKAVWPTANGEWGSKEY